MTDVCCLSLTAVSARNLTLLKCDDRNVARFCRERPFSGRTHRRL